MYLIPALSEGTTRTSSGPFRLERDMFASVSELLPKRIARVPDRWIQLKQPTVGKVVPDLLVGEWGDELRPLKRTFTFIEARILALLEQRDELLENEIAAILHLSEPAATKAFRQIERSELVIRTRDGKLSLDAGAFTRGVIVTAIELKLSRWREALDQAKRYLAFADRAYVVLDAERTPVDERIGSIFRSSRVGLFVLSTSELTELVPAHEQHCVSAERVQAVQKLCLSLTGSGRLHSSV